MTEPYDWSIRAARPDDGPAIKRVLTAAGVAAWSEWLGAERIEQAVRSGEDPADLVAVGPGGEVIGFVAWNGATGEVTRMYTHPEVWGGGAGQALLDRALDALREAGCSQAWLYTEERNERARRFYERHGWRVEGEPLVRDWHGAKLCEPRYVRDL